MSEPASEEASAVAVVLCERDDPKGDVVAKCGSDDCDVEVC